MRILVLGAGTVGTSISGLLCQYGHHVTVVDNHTERARHINEELDVGVVTGSASESPVLFQANAFDADLCLAVTGIDEVNLIAASLAKSMGSRRVIARVFAPAYLDASTFDYRKHFQIDRMLSLEHLTAMEFARGIRNPGSLAVENLARGELEVREIEVGAKARGLGVPLKSLELPTEVRIGSIVRDNDTWIAGANDQLRVGDRLTLIGTHGAVDNVRSLFQRRRGAIQRIFIAGGGETGFYLARALESLRFSVVVMEVDAGRCQFLANSLKRATVVQADATRRAVLEEERVSKADVFVGCLGADEENIMAGVEARVIGAKSIMAVVSRPDYAGIVGKLGIDLAVSPREVMAKQVLSFLTSGPVVSRTSLSNSSICVMELDVLDNTPVTRHPLAKVPFPPQCLIAAIARQNHVKVPGAKDRLKPGDMVIAMVAEASIDAMLTLFSPALP